MKIWKRGLALVFAGILFTGAACGKSAISTQNDMISVLGSFGVITFIKWQMAHIS